MTLTKEVDAEALYALELHPGDVLRVLTENGSTALVQIDRAEDFPLYRTGQSPVSRWIESAVESVQLPEGMTADEAPLAYYAVKYHLDS